MAVALDGDYELHPQVAVRPEPFGALAYHYGNRRLVFLRKPELVQLRGRLTDHPTLAAALADVGIAEPRWPTFVKALDSLEASEIIRVRHP